MLCLHMQRNKELPEQVDDYASLEVGFKDEKPRELTFEILPDSDKKAVILAKYDSMVKGQRGTCIGILGHDGLLQCHLAITNNKSIVCNFN